MKKIIVLGAGMVGSVIAADLNLDFDVTLTDIDPERLDSVKTKYGIKTSQLDASDPVALKNIIAGFDLVVGALPGYMGYEALRNIITSGKDVVDISFFPENPFELNDLARDHNVTAIVDIGVAPGMMHLILGYHNKTMQIDDYICYVGGLPKERIYPYEYKAPFSPIDVIEEYTRPARILENGEIVEKPAMSEPEFIDFAGIGTLEAFNTDGLRTALKTMKIKNMKEKTCRYPGHIEKIKLLRDSGFFSDEEIEINGKQIRPIDITNKILFDKWKLKPEDEELTVIRIIIKGKSKGKNLEIEYNMIDHKDINTGFSSMARTTGFACTGAVRLLLDGKFKRKGVIPPEYIGEYQDCFDYMIKFMKTRNIDYVKSEK